MVADVTPHTISVWAKAGVLHLLTSPKNRYLVCEGSLLMVGQDDARQRKQPIGLNDAYTREISDDHEGTSADNQAM